MDRFNAIFIGICILLGLAMIGLSNRYEIHQYGNRIFKLNKLSGDVYVFINLKGKKNWYELDENFRGKE
jgi:hypothetical protein